MENVSVSLRQSKMSQQQAQGINKMHRKCLGIFSLLIIPLLKMKMYVKTKLFLITWQAIVLQHKNLSQMWFCG